MGKKYLTIELDYETHQKVYAILKRMKTDVGERLIQGMKELRALNSVPVQEWPGLVARAVMTQLVMINFHILKRAEMFNGAFKDEDVDLREFLEIICQCEELLFDGVTNSLTKRFGERELASVKAKLTKGVDGDAGIVAEEG